MIVFLVSFTLQASQLSGIASNNKGVMHFKKDELDAAQKKFSTALSELPSASSVHLNMGLAFYKSNDFEKAEQSYQMALKYAVNDQERFLSLYNLGELAQKKQKKDQALDFYQQALAVQPENREIKVNIELMTQNQNQQQSKNGDSQDQQNQQNKQNQESSSKDQNNQDENGKKEQQEKKPEGPKSYAPNKRQKQEFKSENLTQSDVNKILGEIKRQEDKIRAEYSKKEAKEPPRGKDW